MITQEYNFPNEMGKFGSFGGMYVPETLISALAELTKVYEVTENYQQAFTTIQKVVINSENEVSITLKKAIFSFQLQLFAEARELFKKVIKTFESHPNRQEKIAFIAMGKSIP